MENFKLQQNQQEVFTRIKSEIEQMKLNPVSKEEFYNLFDRSKTLKEKGVDITKEEENEKESHKAKYNSYGVFVKTISEFRYALECLNWYSKKTIDSLVSHE
jgi:gamma-glutamyl phosphate reductase